MQIRELSSYIYSQLVYDKGAKDIQWRRTVLYMMLGKLDSHMKKNKSRPLSYSIHKNNSLNVRPESLKFLEKI